MKEDQNDTKQAETNEFNRKSQYTVGDSTVKADKVLYSDTASKSEAERFCTSFAKDMKLGAKNLSVLIFTDKDSKVDYVLQFVNIRKKWSLTRKDRQQPSSKFAEDFFSSDIIKDFAKKSYDKIEIFRAKLDDLRKMIEVGEITGVNENDFETV